MRDERGTVGPIATLGFCLLAIIFLLGLLAGWLVAGRAIGAVVVALVVGAGIAALTIALLMHAGVLVVRVVAPPWLARWERQAQATPRRSAAMERALTLAAEEARHFHQSQIGTEHLLLGLRRAEGHAARALAACGITLESLIRAVDLVAGAGSSESDDDPPLAPPARRALDTAADYARQERSRALTTAHLLRALAANAQQIAGAVVESLGCTRAALTAALDATRRGDDG